MSVSKVPPLFSYHCSARLHSLVFSVLTIFKELCPMDGSARRGSVGLEVSQKREEQQGLGGRGWQGQSRQGPVGHGGGAGGLF